MKQTNEKPNRFPVLKERLNILLGDMSTKDFAGKVGITRQTMGFYLNGDRIPDSLTLAQICRNCNVSADWLLGFSEDPAPKPCAADELGLSPVVIEGIIRTKTQSEQLRTHSKSIGLYEHLPIDPLSGLNMFLESTLETGLFGEIYMLQREVENEANAVPSSIEKEFENIYKKCGKLHGDSLTGHELESFLVKAYPELAGRIKVSFASINLREYFEVIVRLFRRCLKHMTGYNEDISQVGRGYNGND